MNTKNSLSSVNNGALKSHRQKTAAWILLGGGTAIIITGLAVGTNDFPNDNESDEKHECGEELFYTGLAMMATSIPFFILSHRNARKFPLPFTNQHLPQTANGNIAFHEIPSLNLIMCLP